MPKIKSRKTHRDIKTLDKAAIAGERMKNAYLRSKDTAARLEDDGQGSPGEYAEEQVQYTSEELVHDAGYAALEQGRKLAVKGRETFRARSGESQDNPPKHFFGMTSEETASSHEAQVERGRLYAQQNTQARAADPQRRPRTREQTIGREPEIRTHDKAPPGEEPIPSERGRQFAVHQAQVSARETQRERVTSQATRTVPNEPPLETREATPVEKGRQLAIDRAKARAKDSRLNRTRETVSPPAYTLSRYFGSGEANRSHQAQPVKGETPGRIRTREPVRTVREKERGIKKPARILRKDNSRGLQSPHKLRQKPVKAADKAVKTTDRAARVSGLAARRSAQVAAVKFQRSAQASHAASRAAAVTARAAGKAAVTTAKAFAAAGRSLAALIAGGGTVGVIVIVLIVLIALIAGSCYGVLFTSEDSGTGLTMQSAISQINGELPERIEKIKAEYEGEYDKVELINADSITNWPEVIAIYAVKLTSDKDSPEEVATMTAQKVARLREICWDMNPITAKLVSEEESTVLQITMTPKSYTEMMDEYDFTDEQRKMVKELMDSGLLDKYRNPALDGTEGDFIAIEGTGGYIWPLQGYTRTSSPFGYRICPFHGRELHGGVDIPAPYGTAVHAAKSGKVAISAFGSSYGNYIVLAHGDGTRTLYAHMSARLVSVGQTVSQGQTIGRVGSTGSSTGNHLHFETWTGSMSSSRVNPMLYF